MMRWRTFLAVLSKEFAHHKWSVLILLLMPIALLDYRQTKIGGFTQFQFGGVTSAFVSFWQMAGVILISTMLANLLIISDYKSRNQNFIEGLPIERWLVVAGKLVFGLVALQVISLAIYFLFYFRSRQITLVEWTSIVYPAGRVIALNFAVFPVAVAMALLGKYRWVIYITGAVVTFYQYQFFADLLPFQILDTEQTLGEFGVFPWRQFGFNVLIGIAGIVLALGMAYLIRGKLEEGVSNRFNLADWMLLLIVVVGSMAFAMKVGARITSNLQINLNTPSSPLQTYTEPHTNLVLAYIDRPPEEDILETLPDILPKVARRIEELHELLKPNWWPETWMILWSDESDPKKESWQTGVAGEDIVVLLRWNPDQYSERFLVESIAKDLLHHYIRAVRIPLLHQDKYGYFYEGLVGWHINRHMSPDTQFSPGAEPPPEKLAKLSSPRYAEEWIAMIKDLDITQAQMQHISECLIESIFQSLGEDEFRSWTRRLAAETTVRPIPSTVYDFQRGITYWKGGLDYLSNWPVGLDRDEVWEQSLKYIKPEVFPDDKEE